MNAERDSEVTEYDSEIETLFIQFMMSNHELFVRCSGIIKDSFFDDVQNKDTMGIIINHYAQYSTLPAPEQIKAITGKNIVLIPEVAAVEDRWFLREIECFCRFKSLRDAILSSPKKLDEGRYGEVLTTVRAAVEIALVKDLGLDYYADPRMRLEALRENKGQLSTGWLSVDEKLYGGVNKGELTIFAGQCVTADTKVRAVKKLSIDILREEFLNCNPSNTNSNKIDIGVLQSLYGISITTETVEFLSFMSTQVSVNEYNIIDLHDGTHRWYVDSPDGFVPVVQLISKGSHEIVRTEFSDGTFVHSSGMHCFENIYGGWISPINILPGMRLKSDTGFKTVVNVDKTAHVDLVFDLVVDSSNHRYYTNGVSSHNSGAGKSLFLQNLAVNWATSGRNVVYLSLELSEKLCAMRIDAMHAGCDTREVMRNIEEVHMKIRSSQQKSKGSLRIKQMPNGCTSNDVRAYIKEYEIFSGKKVDAILLDYLDLMAPMSVKISAENLFVKDKYVTEELRNLAVDMDIVMISASQLNRCLSPDTQVTIAGKSVIAIKDVVVGDMILSASGYNTVKDKWKNTNSHVYKVTTESGKEIICSANHRFPVPVGINSIENGLSVGNVLLVKSSSTTLCEDKIVSIEYIGEIETIDITTDGDHLFFGNDILTHNTSYDESSFDPSHIAGGISKVNTADNVIGIFTSAAMKEGGRYQVQFMKTRSSSGVGSRVDLAFNNKTLRITDIDEGDVTAEVATTQNIYAQLKKKSALRNGDQVDPATGEITVAIEHTSRKEDPIQAANNLRAFLKNRS